MADARRRTLERRAAATGAAEDEAAALLLRLRAGQVTRDQLRLAAHLGHQGARLALGAPPLPAARPGGAPGPAGEDVQAVRRWAAGLAPWGRALCGRAAVELARACLPGLAHAPRGADPALVHDLVALAERALAQPTRGALREVRAARERAGADRGWTPGHVSPGALRARLVALEAAAAVCASTAPRTAEALARAAAWASRGVDVRAVLRAALAPL